MHNEDYLLGATTMCISKINQACFDNLLKCKEIFLSNSVYGIRPVSYIKKKLIGILLASNGGIDQIAETIGII